MTPELTLLPGELAVARLQPGAEAPDWAVASDSGLLTFVAAPGETTVVCEAGSVPSDVRSFGPLRALAVAGPLEPTLTGVLASIAMPLAEAEIPIFAISTHDTDYVLVPSSGADDAVATLRGAGIAVHGG